MKAFCIAITDNKDSMSGYQRLVESSFKVGNKFEVTHFDAIVPNKVSSLLKEYKIQWNYPWEGAVEDFASGLTKSAYVTKNPKARVACALSHYTLWKECFESNEAYLILEHDAYFQTALNFDPEEVKFDIIGINNPLGCTRKSREYYQNIIDSQNNYLPVPWIDKRNIPQGLAGNSAYIIKPSGAKQMLDLVNEFGLWPNDAIMCRQLVPKLGVTRTFYTTRQNMRSTTTQ
jgi:GR25 family glycosyltransferase involved in LPS biosynthesis